MLLIEVFDDRKRKTWGHSIQAGHKKPMTYQITHTISNYHNTGC